MNKKELKSIVQSALAEAGVEGPIEITIPPNPEMGDFSFACFDLAKQLGKNPNEVAQELQLKIKNLKLKIVEEVKVVGPYVNFYLNSLELSKLVLKSVDKRFGSHKLDKKKKVMVEFAHPNTHKAFHIGHLRNIITGESVVRILENAGYKVVRANYQGDVGMHIAKCLYAILKYDKDGIGNQAKMDIDARVKYLGEMYARGSKEFEESEKVQAEVKAVNDKIYTKDSSIQKVYQETRSWSLEYFNKVYSRVGSHFDRFYFESEVFERGKELVLEHVKTGVFKESDGAVIFPGSLHGLHDRVFVNSKGFPTYEGKEMALGELQFKEHNPEKIIHVVGKEQSEYFKVVFKALESIFPEHTGKEFHLNYGWVHLKHGKMSSRTGNVVLGEDLLDEVEKEVGEIMKESKIKNQQTVIKKVSLAAVKYAMLNTGVHNDLAFDMKESVSLSGDSGPYLLYIVARIKSILRKSKKQGANKLQITNYKLQISSEEKQLLLKLSAYPEVTKVSADNYDPSKVARYLFELAQLFNNFYHACPVVQAEGATQVFRLKLIKAVAEVMENGLALLGIEAVDEM